MRPARARGALARHHRLGLLVSIGIGWFCVAPAAQASGGEAGADVAARICSGPLNMYCKDGDGDGYGGDRVCVCLRKPPPGFGRGLTDCDDADASVHPGATETCNQRDDDCDAQIDEGLSTLTVYPDRDGDGYGDPASPTPVCDQAPPGYVTDAGDCDDTHASVSPAALERCDGLDNDCDGRRDEGFARYFPDLDGDGFGDTVAGSCLPSDGWLEVRGDCNDADAAVHPGADDPAGGEDLDCGGTDGVDPSVGLGMGALSLQAALDQAAAGAVVWVGPGRYLEHDLSFAGRALTLAATHPAAQTVLDAGGLGHGFRFEAGEGPDTVLDGLTITGGTGGPGGGALISGGSPSIYGCVFQGNTATPGGSTVIWAGGGVAMFSSSARLVGCTFTGNALRVGPNHGRGAALYLNASNPSIDDCRFVDNLVEGEIASGGAVYLDGSSPVFRDCLFSGNEARGETASGGAAFLTGSSPRFEGGTFVENRAVGLSSYSAAQGGAVFATNGSSPTFDNVVFSGNYVSTNVAGGNGGTLFLNGSSPVLTHCRLRDSDAQLGGAIYAAGGSSLALLNCVLEGNRAWGGSTTDVFPGRGGAALVFDSSLELVHCTVVGNSAVRAGSGGYSDSEGGGIFVSGGELHVAATIVAYNASCNLYNDPGAPGAVEVGYSALYTGDGCNHNLSELDVSNTTLEPGFLAYDDAGAPIDLHLALDSPVIDLAGEGANGADADGTAADVGSYGGHDGGGWDLDRDGFADWFWPGGIDDAPEGFDAAAWDCDDMDPTAVCSQNAALTWSVEERIQLKPERPRTSAKAVAKP